MSHLPSFYPPEQVLSMSRGEVLELIPANFADRIITQEEVTHIFDRCDAFWQHDGDPSKPHAELTSGAHSNGFINCRLVLSHTNLCMLFADQALKVIREHYDRPIHWVLGSTSAAADLSKDVANILGARHDVFAQDGKKQVWKGPVIGEGEIVLQVEELMTTAVTTQAVRDGLLDKHQGHGYPISFAPLIFVLIHRSEINEMYYSPVISLAHYDIWNVKPEEVAQGKCELCKQGSIAIPPKTNWECLKGRA